MQFSCLFAAQGTPLWMHITSITPNTDRVFWNLFKELCLLVALMILRLCFMECTVTVRACSKYLSVFCLPVLSNKLHPF